MGGCATKPKALESEEAPTPVEAPTPLDAPTAVATEKFETVPQENENGGETKKEEPLVDVSEPAAEGPKIEEVITNAAEEKLATEEAAAESKSKESEAEAKEEKEVPETEATKETEVAAPKSEEVKAQ